jgi:hypothetical protein
MKSRWITTMVCLLSLSVSSIFGSLHHHDDGSRNNEPCAVCAWHHEGQVDIPKVAIVLEKPRTLEFSEQPEDSFFRELSLKIHPSRGPPFFPR